MTLYLYLIVIINALIEAFSLVLTVYCVSSWFIRDPYNKFMRVLSTIVDPVLDPIRSVLRRIPFLDGLPIDFSPIAAILIFRFVLYIL